MPSSALRFKGDNSNLGGGCFEFGEVAEVINFVEPVDVREKSRSRMFADRAGSKVPPNGRRD